MNEKKKKKSIVKRVFLVLGMVISLGAGSVTATMVHKSDAMLGMINYDTENTLSDVDLSKYKLDKDTEVVNILLIGADKNVDEQDKKGAERRSDSMMIATIDVKHNKLKITTLMRDARVEIPGYGNRKLNAAYFYGGAKLLYKTIAENFGIKMDGYAEVNFDAFVNVIDEIGGVTLKLTESEAKNLNTTNYIKRKKYRNLKVGKQKLNGYQALGYCRIRHGKKLPNGHYPGVFTASGKGDDYGRTERQRMTIDAVLKKVKTMAPGEMMDLAAVVLPNIKTDIPKKMIYTYMMTVAQMGTTELHQFSIPIDNGYHSEKINGEDCLVLDMDANREALKNFIFKS